MNRHYGTAWKGQQQMGQATLVVLLLALVIVAGAALFLTSLAQVIHQDEYLNLFTHQFLQSTLRADTGLTDPACRTVADTVKCAFFNPNHFCDPQTSCTEAARAGITRYAQQVGAVRKGFRYLVTAESEDFMAVSDGGRFRVEVGDTSLKTKKGKRYVAAERLQVVTVSGFHTIKVAVAVAAGG